MAEIATPNPSNLGAAVPSFPFGAIAVTPADGDSFAQPVALYVGTAGNLTVRPANGGAAVLFSNVPAGSVLPVKVRGVNATGTTASGLVAIY